MFGFLIGIQDEVLQLITSTEINRALHTDDDNFRKGIIKRCIDYDKDFALKKLSLGAHQRAVGALYIYSRELSTTPHLNLEAAVRSYALRNKIAEPFTKIDAKLKRVDGRMVWMP